MQQQNKKRYIVFDPDDSPEEMVLRINNEMTKTVEQLEAEAEALRLWFEQQAKIPALSPIADILVSSKDPYTDDIEEIPF